MSANPNANKVDARPTKSFFVDMLTRDISVIDSLLDLCDNALGRTFDLAKADPSDVIVEGKTSRRPLKSYRLKITTTSSSIRIEDNCGGISQSDAKDDIFRLGSDSDDKPEKGLSVYGIGMKRAFFKLANDISLRSSQGSDWFEVAFKVSDWKAQPDDDWSLRFSRRGSGSRPTDIPQNGTAIELKDLRDGVKELIATRGFERDLSKRLQSTYSLFLASGLSLTLNGERLESAIPIVADTPLEPARKLLKINKVQVLIIAGLMPKSVTASAVSSGWFVYCNGRLILDGDKTKTTGWGDQIPQWHTKFSRFVGYVLFNSDDSRELPWTTTKQGVVEDLAVFQKARQEMQVQARPVVSFLSRMYPGDVPEEGVEERKALEKAQPLPLSQVARTNQPFTTPARASKGPAMVNVHYKKPVAKVDLIRAKLGKNLSASDVGSKTFDYFIENELGE